MSKRQEPEREYNSILDGNSKEGPLLSSPMPEKKTFTNPLRKPIIQLIIAVVAVLALLVGGGLFFEYRYEQEYQQKKQEMYNKDYKAGATYFTNAQTEPERSLTEVTVIITEAFYTNDGHMAVNLCMANGTGEIKTVTAAEIRITQPGSETVIAAGRCDLKALEKTVTVPTEGTETLLVYISPDYVYIKDDPLDEIGYSVTLEL